MATNYPGALDTLTNPTSTDTLDSATVPHATQHANANDAIEAIQAELGINPRGSSATVVARLGTLAPLASPALTGNATATTSTNASAIAIDTTLAAGTHSGNLFEIRNTPDGSGSSSPLLKVTGDGNLYATNVNATSVSGTFYGRLYGNASDLASALAVTNGGTGATAKTGTGNNVLSINPSFGGAIYFTQPTPTAVDTTATLTIAQLQSLIITSTTAATVTMTLPTGTLTETGLNSTLGGTPATNIAFDWSIINTGGTNAVTLAAGTAHTIVGSATVAASTTGNFRTRKTALNTYVTYRV